MNLVQYLQARPDLGVLSHLLHQYKAQMINQQNLKFKANTNII